LISEYARMLTRQAAWQRQQQVWADILGERKRQDDKFGEQAHDAFKWLAILMEEVGELSQEALTAHFGEVGNGHGDLREELVQVAAVAVAWLEHIDRENAVD